jgi:hypothetical protein
MKLNRRVKPRRGVLALEWILIITVLVIGVIGGLGLVRNAVVVEMHDLSNSIMDLQVDPNNTNTLTEKSLLNPDGILPDDNFEVEYPIPAMDQDIY